MSIKIRTLLATVFGVVAFAGGAQAADKLVIAATPVPHAELLEFVKPMLAKEGGEIAIRLSTKPASPTPLAVFSISDHGVGIPAADLPLIFKQFHRGSNVQGRLHGTGIGLSGVRLLVEQHGGEITEQSAEGVGTTFTITLPLTQAIPERESGHTR